MADKKTTDKKWDEAIRIVLEKTTEPMHYVDIAEAIAAQGLRTKLGATPAATVSAVIGTSIKDEGEESPFVRTSRGYYALRVPEGPAAKPVEPPAEEQKASSLVNAFGMYWARSRVHWEAKSPSILGQQQGGTLVDFSGQRGVYLLHDGRTVVYVGRAVDQPLGLRLKAHTTDRLSGRWDRFSWFGVYSVDEEGKLETAAATSCSFNLDALIGVMEALLIEGLEPPQNRKRGDDFTAVEFIQVEDPVIKKQQEKRVIEAILNR